MLVAPWLQRIAGLFLLLLGAGFVAWQWHTALTEGGFSPKAAAFFPMFAVLGLGMMLFPIDRAELMAKHGVEKPQSFKHLPPAWKFFLVLAIAAGAGNWIAMINL
jgi:hypothetical protein